MKTKTIEHTVVINAAPRRVYEALMNSKQHAKFTGARASIRARVGGAFTCYDGYLTGFTVELKPARRIVQAWRSRNWPAGTYSIVALELAGKAGGKTQLHFTQVGVPASDYADKNKGWRTHYWEPLKRFVEAL